LIQNTEQRILYEAITFSVDEFTVNMIYISIK